MNAFHCFADVQLVDKLLSSRAGGFVLIGALLICWELFCRLGWLDIRFLPSPSAVFGALFVLMISLELVQHSLVTLKHVISGYVVGACVGYSLGFLCGYMPRIYRLLEVTIEYLRPMPSVALVPIGILFLGLGDGLNTAIVGWACCWPVFINTMDGVRSTDQVLLNSGRTLGVKGSNLVWKIVVPSSLPYVFTGLRVSLGIAIAVAVITEMIASGTGLGAFILNTSLSYRVPEMYAGIIAIGLFGYLTNQIFICVESKVLVWQRGFLTAGK
jgi:ABC-type nitrate/sulfonate/bicarbonate transport system permease component